MSSDRKNRKQKGELFSEDSQGRKTDAHWHDEILNAIDPKIEESHRRESMMGAINDGVPPKVAAFLYGFGPRPQG